MHTDFSLPGDCSHRLSFAVYLFLLNCCPGFALDPVKMLSDDYGYFDLAFVFLFALNIGPSPNGTSESPALPLISSWGDSRSIALSSAVGRVLISRTLLYPDGELPTHLFFFFLLVLFGV